MWPILVTEKVVGGAVHCEKPNSSDPVVTSFVLREKILFAASVCSGPRGLGTYFRLRRCQGTHRCREANEIGRPAHVADQRLRDRLCL
jgi:hypothetical protein